MTTPASPAMVRRWAANHEAPRSTEVVASENDPICPSSRHATGRDPAGDGVEHAGHPEPGDLARRRAGHRVSPERPGTPDPARRRRGPRRGTDSAGPGNDGIPMAADTSVDPLPGLEEEVDDGRTGPINSAANPEISTARRPT